MQQKSSRYSINTMRYCIFIACLSILTGAAICRASDALYLHALDGYPLDGVLLVPGDSRSFGFELDNNFYGDGFFTEGSFHLALIGAFSFDGEIHEMTISISPLGDVGSEIDYLTWGAVINLGGTAQLLEVLPRRIAAGYEYVVYRFDISFFSLCCVLTVARIEYQNFDFPLEMTMTVTLTN